MKLKSPIFTSRAQMGAMRCLAHAFLTTGDNDVRIAEFDRLHPHGHGAKTRAANWFTWTAVVSTGMPASTGLACRVLASARG